MSIRRLNNFYKLFFCYYFTQTTCEISCKLVTVVRNNTFHHTRILNMSFTVIFTLHLLNRALQVYYCIFKTEGMYLEGPIWLPEHEWEVRSEAEHTSNTDICSAHGGITIMGVWYATLCCLVDKFPWNNVPIYKTALHQIPAGNTICTYNFVSTFKRTAIPAFPDK
jgi:hypothetical protein